MPLKVRKSVLDKHFAQLCSKSNFLDLVKSNLLDLAEFVIVNKLFVFLLVSILLLLLVLPLAHLDIS